MRNSVLKLMFLSILFTFNVVLKLHGQDAACGEIVPSDYNTCVSGEIPIFSSLCDVTFSMTPYTVFPQTSICGLPGSITNNPRFVAFVANGLEIVDITVIPSNCTFNGGTQGIQAALLGSCSALDPVGTCQTTCPGINPINLTTDVIPNAGDIIYLMVDGCAFSVCDFVIEFNGGVDFPLAEVLPGTQIVGPAEICGEVTYVIDPPFKDVCNYFWTLPDGTMVETNVPEITFTADPGMPSGQICVQGNNDCDPGVIVPSAPGLCFDIQLASIEYEVIVVQPTCDLNNGEIEITILNGTEPINYTWSPGTVTGNGGTELGAGSYSVTITDGNGCQEIENIQLEETEPIEPSVVTVDIDCATNTLGSATVNVSGGSGSYDFIWSPDVSNTSSASDLLSGDYSVTIIDQNIIGCDEEIDFSIELTGDLLVDIITEETTCGLDNGSISVTPNGIGPYIFTWSQPSLFNEGEGSDLPPGTYNVTIVDEETGCEREESIVIDDSEELQVDETIVNPNCNGVLGSIVLTVTGGSGSYEYVWDPNVSGGNSATDLDAGTYLVTITDSNIPECFIEVDYELEFEGELPVDIVVEDTECNLDNGSIVVTPNGIGPYSFTWDQPSLFTEGSGMDLPGGNYSVTIVDEASGCEGEETITVGDSDALTINPGIINANCNGNLGSINLNVTNGSGNYGYQWDPDVSTSSLANNLVGGTYNITVTDLDISGCFEEISVEVIYVGEIPLTVSTQPTTCNLPNGSIIVVPNGVGPYNYTWSNPPLFVDGVGSNLTSGNYTVTVVDETTGCEQVQNIFVQPSPPLNISSTVVNAECDGTLGSILLNVTNGSGSYTFIWDPAVSNSNSANDLEFGTYNITVVDNNDSECTNTISVVVGLDGELPVDFTNLPTTCDNANGSVELFPFGDGPFSFNWVGQPGLSGSFAINLSSGIYTVVILDLENGCTNTLDIEIEDSEPLEINFELINPTCNLANGSVTVSGSGGSGSYNFDWSTPTGSGDFADNLAPGIYFVTMTDISDNDCFVILDFEVPDSPPLEVVLLDLVDTDCGLSNGSISVEVFNGSGNYLYLWNGIDLGGSSVNNLAPGDYELTIIDLDINGCQITVEYFIEFSEAPPTPTIQGLTELCISEGIGTYSIGNSEEGYIYNWQIIEGTGDIIFGQGEDSVVINWTGGQTGLICVDAWTDCGFTPVQCLPVVLINNPIIDLGNDLSVCGQETTLNGTISNGVGMWEVLSGPGNVVFSNNSNPAATITVDQLGTYVLRFSANQSGCSSFDEITVVFNEGVEVIVTEDCSEVVTYVIAVTINSGLAPFSIQSGNLTGTFNGNIFTSDPIVSGQSYNLVISDANGCLSSVIVGQRECSCDTDAGNMQNNTIRACVGSPIQGQHVAGSENGDATTVFEYILFSDQLNAVGSILATSDIGLFDFDPSTMVTGVTYYIAYVAGIDSGDGTPDYSDVCLDLSNGQPVIWYDFPVGEISGDFNVCRLTTNLSSTGQFNELQWILIDGPGTAIFSPNTSPNTDLTVSGSGIYTIGLALVNGGTCRDTITEIIEFFPSDLEVVFGPSVECNSTGTEFEVVVELGGGSGTYLLVNGGPVSGDFLGPTFRSDFILTDEAFSFTFTDTNGCDTITVSGLGECDCITRVGIIEETLIELCFGSDFDFTYNDNNEILIPGDIVSFVLYEGSLNVIANILAVSSTPAFSFPPGIMAGQTYYIRAIAGQDDGSGFADWNDPCLSESISRPVIWYEIPTGSIDEVNPSCDFEEILLLNSSFANIQWSLVSGPSLVSFNPSDGSSTVFTVSTSGIYEVAALLDNGGLCTQTIFQTIEFLPNDLELVSYDINCNDVGLEFEVEIQLSTSDGPIVLVEGGSTHTGVVNGNIFISETISTGGDYTFIFTDAGGCDTIIVSDIGLCDCETRVGSIVETLIEACDGDDISFTYNDLNEILVPGDVVSFILYEGTLNTINSIIAFSSTPDFEFPNGIVLGQTYYIRVLAGQDDGSGGVDQNDPCLVQSVSRRVVWYELPSGVILEVEPICGNSIILEAAGEYDEVNWSVVSGPGSGIFNPITGENVVLSVINSGIYVVQIEMINEGVCTSQYTIEVEFLSSDLDIPNWDFVCNDLGTEFEVIVELSGGNGNYIVLGESTVLGNFENSVFTSNSLLTDTEFTFFFTDTDGCDTLMLTGIGLCNCITRVGSIANVLTELCEGESLSFNYNNANEVLDPDDNLVFILYEGSATNIINIIDISINPFFDFPGGIILGNTYYIQAIAGNDDGMGGVDTNDPCLRRSTARPVIWYPNPLGAIEDIDPVCGTSTTLEVLGEYDDISWTLVSGPGNLVFQNPNGPDTEINITLPGEYRILATLVNGGLCSTELETIVVFIESDLSFENKELTCDDTNTSFQVEFTLAGGTEPYFVSPDSPNAGTFNGSIFTSEIFPNGSNYEFRIIDNDGCDILVISGIGDCNCETQVGVIQNTPIVLCDGEGFDFVYLDDNEFLDADDDIVFILYEGTANQINVILATSSTPQFDFQSGIELDKVYFIQALAGNSDSMGGVDIDDPCLSRSTSRQVTWRPIPQAIAMVDGVLGCENNSVQLFGSSNLGGVDAGIHILWFNQNGEGIGETNTVIVNEPGEYNVLASNSIGCATRDSIIVEAEDGIISEVNARIMDPTCVGDQDGFIEIVNIIGGVAPYEFSFNGGPFGDISLWDNLADGVYNVRIKDANGCETSRNVPVNNPIPLDVDLGIDLVISEGQEINVGSTIFPQTAVIANYLWTFNSTNLNCSDCEFINLSPVESGIVNLLITDMNGCQAEDAITITILPGRQFIFIPNAFSPNGDQINDIFRIYNFDDVEIINSFSIFDRWGSFVYGAENVAPDDELASWDGRYKGQELNQAVYVYQIKLTFKNGDVRVYAGDVTLLR